ncbi:hypothetical protein PTKIN_Ptkin11bG0197600 [Pterospermum kingtungense]
MSMVDRFSSIIAMASNAAKRVKLPISAGSATLTNDEDAAQKKTSQAAIYAPPSTIRTDFPGIQKLGAYFGIYIGVGTICFWALMQDEIHGKKTVGPIDALYMCVVTMTTIGYGDLEPHSFLAQFVCIIFITVGMCLVGIVIKIAANYLVVKQQMKLANALHTARKLGPVEALDQIESLKIDYNKCLISLIATAAHFVVGVFVLATIEGMDLSDAVYCACSTMTTVGFGDDTFQSITGRMFGIFWISTGTSCVAQLFLYIAEVYTDIETKKLIKSVITSKIVTKKNQDSADNVEDHGKVYGAADFILYKLKEMGKIKQEDISVAMKDLDVGDDQPASDMVLVQSYRNK